MKKLLFMLLIMVACKKESVQPEQQTQSTATVTCQLLAVPGSNPTQYYLDDCKTYSQAENVEYQNTHEGAIGWQTTACEKCDSILQWQNSH